MIHLAKACLAEPLVMFGLRTDNDVWVLFQPGWWPDRETVSASAEEVAAEALDRGTAWRTYDD